MMKAETVIVLIVLVAIGLTIGLVFSTSPPYKLPEELPAEEVKTKEIQTTNFTVLISMGQNICEGCHLSGKKFVPQAYQLKQHAEGGAYCLTCHKIDHSVHPMSPVNKNVTCERCHGITAQIPVFINGTIACAECHDFPDPLKPSYGNLVVIHRPRNVDCAKCHIGTSADTCLQCHSEIKSDKDWEKRLAHFRTLLRTAQ